MGRRIAMSKFGVTQTHEAGMDCFYVPHSIETKLMNPGDKAEARARLGGRLTDEHPMDRHRPEHASRRTAPLYEPGSANAGRAASRQPASIGR